MRVKTVIAAFLMIGSSAYAQTSGINLDTVRAGRFDGGKMWTFEYAPTKYFSDTYGFTADAKWFERARLAALRIPGCSAAFVSPNGLIVTNHHCARGFVLQVSGPGEDLDERGFTARSLAEERKVANFNADQLIAIHDVSAEVFAAVDRAASEAERPAARSAVIRQIEERYRQQHASDGTGVLVQVVGLYAGGRYSAYVFRRYTDVRLVAAPELALGFFGGDADNFTYPRYALDFTFLRVYGPDGKPLASPNYYTWSKQGVKEDDVVFVIGNPGPTTRMNAVAQLEFIRDVQLPAQLRVLQSRWDALNAAYRANPRAANASQIRQQMFGLSNTLKAGGGRIAALNDPVIMARRRDAERQFATAVAANPALKAQYGDVLARLADVQQRKRRHADLFAATLTFGSTGTTPTILRRAVAARDLLRAMEAGVAADSVAVLRTRLLSMADNPDMIERGYLAAQYRQWAGLLPTLDTALITKSVLGDSARTAAALAANRLTMDDPALRLIDAYMAQAGPFTPEWQKLIAEEAEWNSRLGRARFEIYGTDVAPDATFSPRITDGIVKSYSYNGTLAPPYTTFFGMYDRFNSFGPETEWNLPPRWAARPPELDLGTPLNFISTADTYGGNSGSPAVTKNLELVGLNFDRNIEGLSRDYVYLPERGRNVMVDVRAIAKSLDAIYDAHRVLLEIMTGTLYETEAQADAARRN